MVHCHPIQYGNHESYTTLTIEINLIQLKIQFPCLTSDISSAW